MRSPSGALFPAPQLQSRGTASQGLAPPGPEPDSTEQFSFPPLDPFEHMVVQP